jgi:hypothetical protein
MEIIVRPVKSRGAEDKFTSYALMSEVVKGIANPGMRHAEILIHIVKQHRNDPGLPVMTVDNVRVLAGLQHKFQGGPAEKDETLRVVVMTVVNASVKEVPVRMGLDEEAFPSVDEPEEDRTVDPVIVKGNLEVVVHPSETVDMIVAHTVVFRKDDLYAVPPQLKFVAEPVNYVCKTTNFGSRRTFRRNTDDEHLPSVFRYVY